MVIGIIVCGVDHDIHAEIAYARAMNLHHPEIVIVGIENKPQPQEMYALHRYGIDEIPLLIISEAVKHPHRSPVQKKYTEKPDGLCDCPILCKFKYLRRGLHPP
jgi:hypothetical protein